MRPAAGSMIGEAAPEDVDEERWLVEGVASPAESRRDGLLRSIFEEVREPDCASLFLRL